MRSVRKDDIIRQRHLPNGFLKTQGKSTFAIVNPECPISPIRHDKLTIIFVHSRFSTRRLQTLIRLYMRFKIQPALNFVILIIKFLSLMFTLAICTILNGYTQVNIKILLIQSYHTTCVSFSCEFILQVI